MAGMTAKVQTVGVTFEQAHQNVLDEVKSAEWIIQMAREQHAEVMSKPPIPVRWRLFVDGVEANSTSAIKWDSTVRFQYARIDVVVNYAMEALAKLSPVLTGRYQVSHTLLIDGVPGRIEDWDWGSEIVIVNMQPYARKIEIGAMKMRVPGTDHVFQTAAKFTRSRYSTMANISFTFMPLAAGLTVSGPGNYTAKADMRYPVMVIKAIE